MIMKIGEKEISPQPIGIGLVIGIAIGAAIDNVGLGIALGLVFGAAIASNQDKSK